MTGIKTILHPTDFSTQANNAFQLARTLARDFGAKITVVHIRDLHPVISGEFGAFPMDPGDDRKALQNKLREMRNKNQPEVGEALLLEGDPGSEIIALAKRQAFDLIVMGTHGRTGLGRLLMGSVAEQVVREASCPVLTVKTPVGKAATSKPVREEAAAH